MSEPAGRPYDMTPVDFYIHIGRRNDDYRSPLEQKYYEWFKENQLAAWQGRNKIGDPEPGDRSGNLIFNGQFWVEKTYAPYT